MGSNVPYHETPETNSLIKKGKNILRAGKSVGGAFMAASAAIGMYDDLHNNGKTPGQAVTHNAAVLGAGIAGDAVVGTVVALALVSNPGGWAVAASIAGATLATWGFNYFYKNNKWGIRDQLDKAGKKVDKFTSNVHKTVSHVTKEAGEAFKSTVHAMNPFNWGK